jgi:two-component system, OmpR family, manganese sensing response regulator
VAKILLVDDDVQLVSQLEQFLKNANHAVDFCGDGQDAMQLIALSTYDLLILDWSLPGMSGPEICTQYRSRGGQAAVLFLTGRDDIESLEKALQLGADDYVSKPFDIRELNARVNALLRRRTAQFVAQVSVGGVTLDQERKLITSDDTSFPSVRLRSKECILLDLLMRHPGKIFSAQELLEKGWATDADASTDSVRTWMGLLRQKLAEIGKQDLVKTVWGSGYTIEKPPTDV